MADYQETFRNKVLNAVPFFQKVTPGRLKHSRQVCRESRIGNRTTSMLIWAARSRRDRTFFFVSYLGFRRVQGVARSGTVFTDQERAAINQFGVPSAKALLAMVPSASTGNTLCFLRPPIH